MRMRTTLQIDDDILEIARDAAYVRGESLGKVISEMARAGMDREVGLREGRNGVLVFDTPPDAPPITPEVVKRALELDDFQDLGIVPPVAE